MSNGADASAPLTTIKPRKELPSSHVGLRPMPRALLRKRAQEDRRTCNEGECGDASSPCVRGIARLRDEVARDVEERAVVVVLHVAESEEVAACKGRVIYE